MKLDSELAENVWYRENENEYMNAFAFSESILDEIVETMWIGEVVENKVERKNIQSVAKRKKRKLSDEKEIDRHEKENVNIVNRPAKRRAPVQSTVKITCDNPTQSLETPIAPEVQKNLVQNEQYSPSQSESTVFMSKFCQAFTKFEPKSIGTPESRKKQPPPKKKKPFPQRNMKSYLVSVGVRYHINIPDPVESLQLSNVLVLGWVTII